MPGGGPGRNPFGGGGGMPPIGRPNPGGGGGGIPPMPGGIPMGLIPGGGGMRGCAGPATGVPYSFSLSSLSSSSSTCAARPLPLPAHGSAVLLRPEARDERPVLSYQSDRIRGDSMNTTSYSFFLVEPIDQPLRLLLVSSSSSYSVSYTFTPLTLAGFLPEHQTRALTAGVFGSFRSRDFVLVLHLDDDVRDPDFPDQLLLDDDEEEEELLREETDMME